MTLTRSVGLVVAVWTMTTYTSADQTIQCVAPLSENGIRELVAAGVQPPRLRNLIAMCGLDRELVDAEFVESRLLRLGVPSSVLSVLSPPLDAASGSSWISPLDQRQMVFVPAGRFRMGSDETESGRDSDEDSNEISISKSFWIDTGEVTNRAYQRFVLSRPEWQKGNGRTELTGADYLKDWNGTNYPDGAENSPVVWVTWHAARAYAAWAGKRLPTEAEWEYAARAGTTTRYWWGAEYDAQRTADGNPSSAEERLSALRTNAWGLRDTLGGVWEWTLSLYRPYPYVSTDGREDMKLEGARAIRGGSRVNGEAFLRSANRSREEPLGANDLLGFRCAR